MEPSRLIELLQPFLPGTGRELSSPVARSGSPQAGGLASSQIENFTHYLDLLLLWNARVNLTAVRKPEDIVARHFGESLFAAQHLFPTQLSANEEVIDFGSGAGFPGLPMKIWAPNLRLTLIESNLKKATFLREAVRKLALNEVEVFCERAEKYASDADVVTLRAVEHFEEALPVAVRLVRSGGRLALLIGEGQIIRARDLTSGVVWEDPLEIPFSSRRVLLIGKSFAKAKNQVRHESEE